MCLFTVEYLMICKLFSCKIFNFTSCDFVYVFSILSLIVELTRFTPEMKQFNYYSLDANHTTQHIDNWVYWEHKLYDAFIEFIVLIRVVHSILRFVIYYIYGKEYRHRRRNHKYKKLKTSTPRDDAKTNTNSKPVVEKNGYQQAAMAEVTTDEDNDEASSDDTRDPTHDEEEHEPGSTRNATPLQIKITQTLPADTLPVAAPKMRTVASGVSASATDDTQDKEPVPFQPNMPNEFLKIVDDEEDNTAPLPRPRPNHLPPPIPIMTTRNSVELLNNNVCNSSDNEERTPKYPDPIARNFKLRLANLTPMSRADDDSPPVRIDDDDDAGSPFHTTGNPQFELQKSRNSQHDIHAQPVPLTLNRHMLSPPAVHVEPSDVDTQSIERIELMPRFQPQTYEHVMNQEAGHSDNDYIPLSDREENRNNAHKNDSNHQIGDEREEQRFGDALLEEASDEIMKENGTLQGRNWGIFPMFTAKLGIISDTCIALVTLVDHEYMFIARILVFAAYFVITMYVSAHSFVQFIRSFIQSNKPFFDKQQQQQQQQNAAATAGGANPSDNLPQTAPNLVDRASTEHFTALRRPSEVVMYPPTMTKQPTLNDLIPQIVLNPHLNQASLAFVEDKDSGNGGIDNNGMVKHASTGSSDFFFASWNTDDPMMYQQDIEFRTGSDDIKKIVRNMLENPDDKLNTMAQAKLKHILAILQDIEVMEKGNIEEKIDLDQEIDDEAKRWLNMNVLSKPSRPDNDNTPHFDFHPPLHSTTAASIAARTASGDDKTAAITPYHPRDTNLQPQQSQQPDVQIISPNKLSHGKNQSFSPPKLNVLSAISPNTDKDAVLHEDKEQNYTLVSNHSYDHYDDMDANDDEYKHEEEGSQTTQRGTATTVATTPYHPFDIAGIIEEKMQSPNILEQSLIHLSPEIDRLTAQIVNLDTSVDTFELNRLTGRPLLHSAMCLFLKYGFHEKLDIQLDAFYKFVDHIERSYHSNNPYHNKMHATEVMMASMMLIDNLENTVQSMLTTMNLFAAFIAAIIHDVDHPGNTNAFEINTGSEWALLYSDQSVLEFHHLWFAFNALRNEQRNFARKWDKATTKEFRKQCIYSVLATDLSKHFDTVSHVKQLKIVKDSDLEYVFKAIIKMSDLSHVTKPLYQHKLWTKRITQEFHNQGDRELHQGMEVSPLCNRQNTKIAKGQVGFMKHVVSPLYNASQRFFAKNSRFDKEVIQNLHKNRTFWETEAKKEESVSFMTEDTVTPKTAISSASALNKTAKAQQTLKQRPQSATFSTRTRKIAILTNLEGTPPPILPSSVRELSELNKSGRATQLFSGRSGRHFFPSNANKTSTPKQLFRSPHQHQYRPPRLPPSKQHTDSDDDIAKGGNIVFNHMAPPNRKRIRSSSANSAELPAVDPKLLNVQKVAVMSNDNLMRSDDDSQNRNHDPQQNVHSVGKDKHGENADGTNKVLSLQNTSLSMLASPPSMALSPRSLLRLGNTSTSPISTKSMKLAENNASNASQQRAFFKSLTPKSAKTHTVHSRMAISPNSHYLKTQRNSTTRRSRKRKNDNAKFLRTKSSETATEFDGSKLQPLAPAKFSRSDSLQTPDSDGNSNANNNNNENGKNNALHVISPDHRRISPYSKSHDGSKRLINRHDEEHAVIHEEKSSSDDRPHHFKFEPVPDENK